MLTGYPLRVVVEVRAIGVTILWDDGLMRGSLVIGVGCVPAHIGLFSTYEFTKASRHGLGSRAGAQPVAVLEYILLL